MRDELLQVSNGHLQNGRASGDALSNQMVDEILLVARSFNGDEYPVNANDRLANTLNELLL